MIEMPNSSAKTFTTDEEELIPGGDYEVSLSAEPKTYGEKIGLSCRFKIRSDIQQKAYGTVFDTIWMDKDQVNWQGWFDHRKLQKIILTQDSPKLDFKDCDECVQYINGLNMVITITDDFDDYKGKRVNNVKFLSYKKSMYAPALDAKEEHNTAALNMPENELPF